MTQTHFLRRNPSFGSTIFCCHTTKTSQNDTSTVSDRLGTHSFGRVACFWMVVTDSSAHPWVIMSRMHSLPWLNNTHIVYVCERECKYKFKCVLSISVVLFISDKKKNIHHFISYRSRHWKLTIFYIIINLSIAKCISLWYVNVISTDINPFITLPDRTVHKIFITKYYVYKYSNAYNVKLNI